MSHISLFRACIFALLLVPNTAALYATPANQPPPPVMGLWSGEWIDADKSSQGSIKSNPELTAEVIGLGGDQFQLRFMHEPFKRAHILFETEALMRDGKITFESERWRGEVLPDLIKGQARTGQNEWTSFELTPLRHSPPSLGMAPPEDAIILFDGSGLDAWSDMEGESPTWQITPEGNIEIVVKQAGERGNRSIRSREVFGDMRMHLEYFIPYQPERRGQNRGNSGVFLQGVYEVQILDSFGSDGLWIENGALYKVSPPRVNASLPPGQWQTYDIDFRAARFGPNGDLMEYPRISVLHNGIPIHTDVELLERTAFAQRHRRVAPVSEPGPVILQEHGSPIQFRNIWVIRQ